MFCVRVVFASRNPQDAPRTPQDTPRSGELGDRFGMETRFPTEFPPDLDFGASWDRFWEILGSIFGAFSEKFAEHWGAFAIQDRFKNLPSASLQKERRFPFHVKSGLCWASFCNHLGTKKA